MANDISTQLKLKDLELKALFEIIRAINANASEGDLYKIYKFIIRSNPNIAKLALYVLDDQWACKTYFGTQHAYEKIELPEALLEIHEAGSVPPDAHFSEFDRVIPVKHKTQVLAYVLISKYEQLTEEALQWDFIDALSNIIIVAIENKKMARREQRQKESVRQLEIAREVQAMLVPKKLPNSDWLQVEASYLPHHTIGGDYYDFIQVAPHQFLLCIADVSGKGIPAALLMSNFQAGLRVLSQYQTDLSVIVQKLNALIMQNSNGQNFITAFFAHYDSQKRELTYINAGHNPPFLFVNGQESARLEEGCTILGGFSELPFLEKKVLASLDDFFIFCFTDGFTETYNKKGEEFGDAHLLSFLQDNQGLPLHELHPKLIALLNTFKGENAYVDDITLLSCRVRLPQNG